MKTILRRLQQLERHSSESLAANDASGARARILERINAMADPRRGHPNWETIPKLTVAEVRQRLQEALSGHKSETEYPRIVRQW